MTGLERGKWLLGMRRRTPSDHSSLIDDDLFIRYMSISGQMSAAPPRLQGPRHIRHDLQARFIGGGGPVLHCARQWALRRQAAAHHLICRHALTRRSFTPRDRPCPRCFRVEAAGTKPKWSFCEWSIRMSCCKSVKQRKPEATPPQK